MTNIKISNEHLEHVEVKIIEIINLFVSDLNLEKACIDLHIQDVYEMISANIICDNLCDIILQ